MTKSAKIKSLIFYDKDCRCTLFDNAMALPSFVNIVTCTWEKNEILAQMLQQRKKLHRWIYVETLIIDEGSVKVLETVEFSLVQFKKIKKSLVMYKLFSVLIFTSYIL